jgi:hypothetical protein
MRLAVERRTTDELLQAVAAAVAAISAADCHGNYLDKLETGEIMLR